MVPGLTILKLIISEYKSYSSPFLFTVTQGKTLLVSHNGTDSKTCGRGILCRTIEFVLSHRAANNDIIVIVHNKFSKVPEPFTVTRSFPLLRNLTLLGHNGRPVISGQNSSYLFQQTKPQTLKFITLRIKNLIFKRIGIARLSGLYHGNNVSFQACHFENLVTDLEIIRIESHVSFVHFHECLFTNNRQNLSRAISINRTRSVFTNCYFVNNLSAVNGSIHLTGGCTSFKENSFVNNTAVNVMGGVIYAAADSVTEIANSSFKGNRALLAGGAIFSSGRKLSVTSSTFELNTASSEFGFGGAISLSPKVDSEISNSSFKSNAVNYRGGAIFCQGKKLLIKSSSFIENTATEGAAMSISSHNTLSDIFNCSFKGNKLISNGGGDGGAILFHGYELLIRTSSFDNNNAAYRGGAISVIYRYSKCDIDNCVFKRNSADYIGGAILFFGKELLIKASLFYRNNAENGGAIYFMADEKDRRYMRYEFRLLIKSSTFNNNYARSDGGAVATDYTLNSNITNCSFMKNSANAFGGAIRFYGNELLIETSSFCSNNGKIAGAVYFLADDEHYLDKEGYTVGIKFKLLIKSTNFSNNSAMISGGALLTDSKVLPINSEKSGNFRSEFSSCFFESNRATLQGGAIKYVGKELYIDSSHFHDNRALGAGGEAGALHVKGTHVNSSASNVIRTSTFKENKASYRGGAIVVTKMILCIRESTFSTSSYPHDQGYFGGEFLFSLSKVTLEHVSLKDFDNHNVQNSLIKHPDFESSLLVVSLGVRINCAAGKYIEVFNLTNQQHSYNSFTSLVVFCSFCSSNFYSLSAGELYSQKDSIKTTDKKCYKCPLGGLCEKGKLKATDNSWGYIYRDKVHFSPCPVGYCCVQKECTNYSSCHKGRKGVLCGQCEEGLTENLVTPDCLLPKNCRHPYFLLITIITGIGYVVIFTYLKETVNIVQAILVPGFVLNFRLHCFINLSTISGFFHNSLKIIASRFTYKLSQRQPFQSMTNDVTVEEPEIEERHKEICDDTELHNNQSIHLESLQDSPLCDNKRPNIFPGLLKILIFFYQVNILFKASTGLKTHSFAHTLQEAVSTLFNLRIDGIFTQDLSWCPIDRLQPVSKILVKNSFAVYLFTLIIFAFLFLKIGRLFKIISTENYELNKSRLLCCSLRFILISYAGITSACFSLLFCVQLGSSGNVLYIDGSITCYKWFQQVVIFVVCFWISPLPIAIYTSCKMLRNQLLSARGFLLCLVFPLPAILYWLFIWVYRGIRVSSRSGGATVLNNSAQEALEIMEGPFRKVRDNNKVNNSNLSWESILITRRLILVFIKTFVINVFLRLSLMLLFMTLCFGHHIYSKPFSSNLLNAVDTVSLLMLTIICFINLAPAYNYTYLSGSNIHVEGVIQTLQEIETVLTLVFPFLTGLCITVLILRRIFQFLFWVCRCFMRIIIYIKRNVS